MAVPIILSCRDFFCRNFLIWFIASKLWFIVIKSRSDDSGIDSFGIDLSTVFWIWFIDIKWKARWFWNWFVWIGLSTLSRRPDDSGFGLIGTEHWMIDLFEFGTLNIRRLSVEDDHKIRWDWYLDWLKTRWIWIWFDWNWFINRKSNTIRFWIWFIDFKWKTRWFWDWFDWYWITRSRSQED